MRSFRFLVSRRWALFALTVVLLAWASWWLGEWQFHRLGDREERNETTSRNLVADPAPVVAVSELGDSSVNFVVRPWVLSSNFHAVKFHLIEQIKLGFDARGLTIPFPSRDVFVHHSMGKVTLPFVNDSSSIAA